MISLRNVFISAVAGSGMLSVANAEDFKMVPHEKALISIYTKSFSVSQTRTYSQYIDWEESIKRDTEAGFKSYLGAMKDVATITGNAPVDDVVPGVGNAREYISENVNKDIDRVNDMYDSFVD